ncbi:hypothetical protein OG884_33790 [Streptosporangium sp. NBC_01755]|uniref:hypothetical protein n=1 Tax=unclassified Streptosporangium TaxID=2632669 RepID=UPI002DD95800|nr:MULTISPECIES: hypothetical protein [unclassified Streptosporangium]WSA28832.1 hypothetical protein OIE13_13685 [Streptosporangium sp. NBC_01810]WSC99720.1 hypothetical protein OG884_33790 [Streptosporangium sp. NBC_01755]
MSLAQRVRGNVRYAGKRDSDFFAWFADNVAMWLRLRLRLRAFTDSDTEES